MQKVTEKIIEQESTSEFLTIYLFIITGLIFLLMFLLIPFTNSLEKAFAISFSLIYIIFIIYFLNTVYKGCKIFEKFSVSLQFITLSMIYLLIGIFFLFNPINKFQFFSSVKDIDGCFFILSIINCLILGYIFLIFEIIEKVPVYKYIISQKMRKNIIKYFLIILTGILVVCSFLSFEPSYRYDDFFINFSKLSIFKISLSVVNIYFCIASIFIMSKYQSESVNLG